MGRGKTRASLDLIDSAHEILEEIKPATVRAVCYRLFIAGVLRDMSKAETNKVSAQLVFAREVGVIPWAWIVDETRQVERVSQWSNPGEILATVDLPTDASRGSIKDVGVPPGDLERLHVRAHKMEDRISANLEHRGAVRMPLDRAILVPHQLNAFENR